MLASSGAIRSSAQPFECLAISSSSSARWASTWWASSREKGLAPHEQLLQPTTRDLLLVEREDRVLSLVGPAHGDRLVALDLHLGRPSGAGDVLAAARVDPNAFALLDEEGDLDR